MRAIKEWTAEVAMKAQRAFEDAGGAIGDPTGPIAQWAALKQLSEDQRAFEMGSKRVVLAAIAECAVCGLVMPDWLVRAYLDAYRSVIWHKKKSWDDAFGRAHKKGVQLAAVRKEHRLAIRVHNEVRERNRKGEAIDDELFASVGKKLGLGLTLTKRYYASWKERTGQLPPVVIELLAPLVAQAAEPDAKRKKSRRRQTSRKLKK